MGGRFENMKELKPFYSSEWVRPMKSEGLKAGVENVENGCYW